MTDEDDRVSRRRYNRALAARAEAEALLEEKSRELFLANEALAKHSAKLEQAVLERTADLRLALERAEAASAARSRFLATMSHEIRTPLGGLLGMIDLVAMEETVPEKLELLGYARTAGLGLSRIVNEVLDFSKMEAGVFLFEQENVDLRAMLESIRILVSSHEHGKDRRLIVRIDKAVPKLFLCDATRVRQVLSNLVSNALRYSTDGPVIIHSEVRDGPDGDRLRLEVEDFGVGIAKEDIGNLFKDFTQISNPLTAAAQGTGLGLAICKRVIEGLGGKIGVTSTPEEGSIFWFELPLMVPDMAALEDAESATDAAPVSLEGARVLIAEDNVINQKLLLTYADRMGMTADLAHNGRIALEKFSPGKYDLILMDVAMPEMDGLEATRHLHTRWPGDQLPPILALTAHLMDAVEQEARSAGISRILSKPIPFEELQTALRQSLRTRKTPQQAAPPSAPPASVPEATKAARAEVQTRDPGRGLTELMDPKVHQDFVETFGLEGLSDFAAKFVKDSATRIEVLLAADAAGDTAEVTTQAHSLRGAAMAFGFPDMVEWAGQIEKGETHLEDASVAETAARFKARLNELDAAIRDRGQETTAPSPE
ncbi:MAG: response regulator [Rhodobacteraceae bacterium]|nr:response regulator [Paracoccaceae bacterium]